MIVDTLPEQIKEALKKGDTIRVSTLRLLSNALHNEKIAKQKELSEEEEISMVRREIKKREEATLAYERGARPEASEKERREAEVLKEFLPAQISESELNELVNQVIEETGASGPQDFGKAIGAVMAKVAGRADGKTLAEAIRRRLS